MIQTIVKIEDDENNIILIKDLRHNIENPTRTFPSFFMSIWRGKIYNIVNTYIIRYRIPILLILFKVFTLIFLLETVQGVVVGKQWQFIGKELEIVDPRGEKMP